MDSKSLTKTSFCGKEIDNVTNNELKKHILDDMCQKTSITYKSRYAKMFNQQFLKNFNNPHILCLKTIGSPYLLYCTQINDVNYCFLVDKKIKDGYDYPKIFLVHYRFNEEIFNGTLFETELLKNNDDEWFLLIGDIYSHNGISVFSKQVLAFDEMFPEIFIGFLHIINSSQHFFNKFEVCFFPDEYPITYLGNSFFKLNIMFKLASLSNVG